MTRGVVSGVLTAVALLLAPASASAVTLVPLAPASTWGSPPMFLTAPANDPRLFVVERSGAVRIAKGGAVSAQPFLSIPNVDTVGERGLQSIVFAPDYATSGLLYAFYTALGADSLDPGAARGDVRVVEYRRSASDPDAADPASARLVLKVAHGADNHNGGQLTFGHDGLLYITIGDNAVSANAQDLANLLGKVLRIDPRDPDGIGLQTYAIPASNPFLTNPGAREEIYALGLRNPFRASIAPNGALVVGDVGNTQREEVDVLGAGGGNYGWPICEGFCSSPNPSLVDPLFDYPHSGPTVCAVIGGHVVRDFDLPELMGRYLYGDLCASDLRTLNLGVTGGDPRQAGASLPTASLQSFGESAGGCAYALTATDVYRVAPNASTPAQCPRSSIPVPETRSGRDTTKPRLTLKLRKRQRLARFVTLTARCSESCTLRASGRLRFTASSKAGAAKAPTKLRRATRRARANTRVRLRLRTTKPLRKRARNALKAKRGVVARIEVVATDVARNSSRKRVRVKLLLPRPR